MNTVYSVYAYFFPAVNLPELLNLEWAATFRRHLMKLIKNLPEFIPGIEIYVNMRYDEKKRSFSCGGIRAAARAPEQMVAAYEFTEAFVACSSGSADGCFWSALFSE